MYIDALAMFLVLDPGQFEVIVTNNLFGDIITDIGGRSRAASAWRRRATCTRADVDVRAGPRLGAEVRREEHRQPDGRDRCRRR
jgi:hypothetical protein